MTEHISHQSDSETRKAGRIDKRESPELHPVATQMKAILDAFEEAGELVVSRAEVFDDLIPDENGEPYVGTRRWMRIGVGARTDTEAFPTFIPSYLNVSLSQPDSPVVHERYAGGVAVLQHTTDHGELSTLSLSIRHNKLWDKSLVHTRAGHPEDVELSDRTALDMLRLGTHMVAADLVEVAAGSSDEEKSKRCVNIVKSLIDRGAVMEADLDQDTWETLVDLYGIGLRA